MKIKTRQELEAKRAEYAASLKTQKKQILICAGTGCVAGGSLNIYARLQEILKERGIKCSLVLEKEPHEESVGLKKSGCHGFCEMGPLLRIEPAGLFSLCSGNGFTSFTLCLHLFFHRILNCLRWDDIL